MSGGTWRITREVKRLRGDTNHDASRVSGEWRSTVVREQAEVAERMAAQRAARLAQRSPDNG